MSKRQQKCKRPLFNVASTDSIENLSLPKRPSKPSRKSCSTHKHLNKQSSKRCSSSSFSFKKTKQNEIDCLTTTSHCPAYLTSVKSSQISVQLYKRKKKYPRKNSRRWEDERELLNTVSVHSSSSSCTNNNSAESSNQTNLLKISCKTNTKTYRELECLDSEDDLQSITPKHSVHLPKLEPREVEFLQLVIDDNISGVKKIISRRRNFNINCSNFQGVTALHLAIQNRSEAMVKLLLSQPNIEIGDTVLHAVRDNNVKILVMLLNAQQNVSPGLEFTGATHSAHFPDHVTPLILAAQEDHYEIVALLVSRGHTIDKPHLPHCHCGDCMRCLFDNDPLDLSSARLSIYRAIASPAFIVHISSDPILTAFILTAELAANADAYRQLAPAYLQLQQNVSAFAVDLIGCCRTSEEVEIILKHSSGTQGQRHFILPRLLMAMDFKQKEFVAHPNTQQILESYWLGNWYSWRRFSTFTKALIVLSRVFITPVILLFCVILPKHSYVKYFKIPLNKLITHAAAYFVFLGIIFFISNQDKTDQKRGPPNTGAEPIVILYVLGYTWSTVRMCVMQGPKRYFTEMWNWGEIIMILLFYITFGLWIIAACDTQKPGPNTERKYWDSNEPTLLAEGTFCLATIFAYFRLLFLCQLNYHLGPLQVSLGKMTVDIYKYIIIFAILIAAFTAGLSHFYQYYDGMVYEDEYGMKTVQVSSFTSLYDTLNTLFWALFCMAPLESADVVIENLRKGGGNKTENSHDFTERVGYFCFACFEVLSVIIVLNMLIATMSNTFQKVTDNVAIEWTFGRTEVYIDYISQSILPSPYNMIPTASGMGSIIEWFRNAVKNQPGVYARWSPSYCCYIEKDVEACVQREFPTLMSVLVQRYFRDKLAVQVSDAVVETELESLRRELTTIKTILERKKI